MGIPGARPTTRRRQRAQFRALRECFDRVRDAGLAVDTLSMGMSADLEAAIAEGSTEVRVGTAIFGARIVNVTFVGGGNMATALIGGLCATARTRATFASSSPSRAQQDKLAARFPGIGIFGEPTAGAVDGADLVVLAVKPQQMKAAAQALAPYIDGVPVVMTIAAGTRLRDLSRWLGGYRAHRARDAQHAGAGRRRHQRRVRAAEVDAARRELAGRVLEAVGRGDLGRARGHARCGDRRIGQRPRLCVLLPRRARGGGARARLLGGERAQARVRDLRRRDQARAGVRRCAGHAARAGHVEGRHHRARAR